MQEIILRLNGLHGPGYSFGDLISDIFVVVSILAQVGVIADVYSAMKSLFIKDVFFDALEVGSELAKHFKDEFVESSYSSAFNAVLKKKQKQYLQIYQLMKSQLFFSKNLLQEIKNIILNIMNEQV